MPDDPDREATDVAQQLTKVLDSHGHGFQYRALLECNRIGHQNIGLWKLIDAETAYELPNGQVGHIDGVLQLIGAPISDSLDVFAVIECKRVDPKLGRWAFVQAPFGDGTEPLRRGVFDVLELPEGSPIRAHIRARLLNLGDAVPFGLGFELRNHKLTGEGNAGSVDGINKAVTQVLRGTVGLLMDRRKRLQPGRKVVVIPVVLTTAELWTSSVELARADLGTGHVADVQARARTRVVLTVRATRDLTVTNIEASIVRKKGVAVPDSFAGRQIESHSRTIWIASAAGIRDMLLEIAAMVTQEF